ncbi:MAG: hypothetical protein ACHQII_08145 [Bacteroidia bacterium]
MVKDGVVNRKQRYLCLSCRKTTRVGDAREKYTAEKKIRVIKLYTEGVGIRAIERLESVSAALIVHWIRGFGKMIRKKLSSTKVPDDVKSIAILEMDELFTYFKKKTKKPMFGLLWTETGIKLLILQ